MRAARDLLCVSYAVVLLCVTFGYAVFCASVVCLSYCFLCSHGCNRWRDNQSPVAILDEYCVMWGLGEPVWDGNSKVKVGEDSYNLHTFGR